MNSNRIKIGIVWLLLSVAPVFADPLPPPADMKVNFDRDIRPMLESSCIRCHGPEKPRSHFRLDNRLDALKGGDDNTNDIVAGNSTASRLIRYVAHQVPDMQMPPEGRGNPLTTQQIALLRAWIDQGVDWKTTNQPRQLNFAFAPAMQWIDVACNKSKFRELEGTPAGFAGGVDRFSVTDQISPDTKALLSGHVITPGRDVDLSYTIDRNDLGFIHAGFTDWRKYYDDTGGFDPTATPSQFNLSPDLHVDNGRAWIDFGLTLPRWPEMILGYEYQFRTGTSVNLDWGYANGKNIYSATEGIDEKTHIVKFTVTDDFDDWHVENNARVEFYRVNNESFESQINLGGTTADTFVNTKDNYRSVQGVDTLTIEKQVRDWWFLSGGFYYSKLAGSDFFNQLLAIPSESFSSPLASEQITLRRESEIFSVASLFTPVKYFAFSLGSQNEWASEEGVGAGVPQFDLGINTPASSSSDWFKSSQNAEARFTLIPFSVIYADAELEQESLNEMEEENDVGFDYKSAVTDNRYDVRAGFNTSPWRWFDLNLQYERQFSDTSYNNPVDVYNAITGPTNGYPGFILDRKIQGNDFETRLDLHPTRWLKTAFTAQISDTRYSSTTDPAFDFSLSEPVSPGGAILDGHYDQQTLGISAVLTPVQQFYLSSTFTYTHSRAVTADNGDTSVVPYTGDIFTVITTANYAWNPRTALQASYIFTSSDYGQNNAAAGLPTGLDFNRHELLVGITRKFTKRLTGALHYEFSQYIEPSDAGANNFTANGIFASIAYTWP